MCYNKRGPLFVFEQQNKICLLSFVTFLLLSQFNYITNHMFFANSHFYLTANTGYFI